MDKLELLRILSIAFSLVFLVKLHDESPLINCQQLNYPHVRYEPRNGIDYYIAQRRHQLQHQPNQVTTNLKSILPAQLAASQQDGFADALPQVANSLGAVRNSGSTAPNGVHRVPKQIRQGFDTPPTELPTNELQDNDQATTVEQQRPTKEASSSVCLTPGCVKAAAEILKNIDEKVDPCDDFYKYSCGNWIESQVIPEDKTSVSLFSVVQDELDNKLRNLIEVKPNQSGGGQQAATPAQEPPIVNKMRNLYESCMNTSEYSASDLSSQLPGRKHEKLIRAMMEDIYDNDWN